MVLQEARSGRVLTKGLPSEQCQGEFEGVEVSVEERSQPHRFPQASAWEWGRRRAKLLHAEI